MDEPHGTDRKFLFLLGSSRPNGNTEILARQAAAALPATVSQQWLRLRDVPLTAFEDVRHAADGHFPEPTGNERLLFDSTLEATDLVVASPLYWYTVSASMKLYLDHWSGWLRIPGVDFRTRMQAKTMWVVTAFAGDRVKADPSLETLRLCAGFFGMRFGERSSGTVPALVTSSRMPLRLRSLTHFSRCARMPSSQLRE